MADWKVNDGVQVKYDGKLYGPGDTFSAPKEKVAAFADLVSHVPEKKADAPAKAQASSPNKAQRSGHNK